MVALSHAHETMIMKSGCDGIVLVLNHSRHNDDFLTCALMVIMISELHSCAAACIYDEHVDDVSCMHA